MIYNFLIFYLILISIISIIVTVWDKISAIAQKRRVPERVLLTLSAVGGSVAMLVTMLIIRHKTRKPKFMIGIPAIILLQLILILLVVVNL
ncbi:MAG: DUF1294 domain-containing protein [Ruminococcus sp.]|nr:DUF1294 domain-containing protein [Ruminococcus sp.]